MPYPNKTEQMKARERLRALQMQCVMGKHNWQPSVSSEYKMCFYCKKVRKIDAKDEDDHASLSG